ncbi:MAG: zinc transporter ZupT [Dehalococcoidales bacterium]|nr:zinc transporter ZupT [Dehalococcoidales bacterium]
MDINVGFALLLTTLAGLSTGIGSLIAFFIRKPNTSYLSFLLGLSAGVMVYISFTELLGTAIDDVGFLKANIAFFVGIIVFAIIDILIPHSYEEESADDHRLGVISKKEKPLSPSSKSALKRGGIFIALGIAIHNFPEGLITFSAAATGDVSLGIMIAVAVALHNIPEGIAVSVPILYSTGSRKKAFGYSFLSGLAEPVGALLGFLVLTPFLTPDILSMTLAFVAGIMVYISLDEILPMAHRYAREHLVIIGVVAGMAIMALSLLLLG